MIRFLRWLAGIVVVLAGAAAAYGGYVMHTIFQRMG